MLPNAIESALPEFENGEQEKLWVVVRNGFKKQVLPVGTTAPMDSDHARRSFQFVYTDWSIALQGDFAAPETWARVNFTYNLTLSVVLVLVLLGGIALTIRTALREMKLSAMKNEFVFQRVARVAHAALLDPGVRRIHAPGAR